MKWYWKVHLDLDFRKNDLINESPEEQHSFQDMNVIMNFDNYLNQWANWYY